MGKANAGRGYEPPAQNQRKKTGEFNRKVGRKENKEVEAQAIARKQGEPYDAKRILAWLSIFGAVSAILYLYLNYILQDDDDDIDLPAAATPVAEEAS